MRVVQKINRPLSTLGIALANCSISGTVGCNLRYFNGFSAKDIADKLSNLLNDLKAFAVDVHSSIEKIVLLENGQEFALRIEIERTRWSFRIESENEPLDIDFDTEQPVITDLSLAQRLCFLLATLVHDENEAYFLASCGLQLAIQLGYSDVLPDLITLKEIIALDLVRAQRVKLNERDAVLKEIIAGIQNNSLPKASNIGDRITFFFSNPDYLLARRNFIQELEAFATQQKDALKPDDFALLCCNLKLSKVELRLDYHSEAYRDWQIGYSLLNGIMVLCTNYVGEALGLLEAKDYQGSSELMKKAARTQEMSADIMAFVGSISRESYAQDIRFKLGGSGGTDHHSHRKLRGFVMKYMTLLHDYIENTVLQSGPTDDSIFLTDLDHLMKATMKNKVFKGHKEEDFVHISEKEARAYSDFIDTHPHLKEAIEGAMAFKAAHMRVFECHQHVCKKLVPDDAPSLLGNKVDDLRNRVFPVISVLESARETLMRSTSPACQY